MKNIRHSVFETNSSSTHSISIAEDSEGLYETIIPDDDGVITLVGGEFGWEWEVYNDAWTKANYAAIDSCTSKEKTDMLIKVIKEHTGAKEVIINADNSYDGSYIDHQSIGTTNFAFQDEKTLKTFIFSAQSYLFTGNDNDDAYDGFYEPPGMSFACEIKLEGISKTKKLRFYPNLESLKKKACIKNILDNSTNHSGWKRNHSSYEEGVICEAIEEILEKEYTDEGYTDPLNVFFDIKTNKANKRSDAFASVDWYNLKDFNIDPFENLYDGYIKAALIQDDSSSGEYKKKLLKVKDIKVEFIKL
jgi:hypothetical protein